MVVVRSIVVGRSTGVASQPKDNPTVPGTAVWGSKGSGPSIPTGKRPGDRGRIWGGYFRVVPWGRAGRRWGGHRPTDHVHGTVFHPSAPSDGDRGDRRGPREGTCQVVGTRARDGSNAPTSLSLSFSFSFPFRGWRETRKDRHVRLDPTRNGRGSGTGMPSTQCVRGMHGVQDRPWAGARRCNTTLSKRMESNLPKGSLPHHHYLVLEPTSSKPPPCSFLPPPSVAHVPWIRVHPAPLVP